MIDNQMRKSKAKDAGLSLSNHSDSSLGSTDSTFRTSPVKKASSTKSAARSAYSRQQSFSSVLQEKPNDVSSQNVQRHDDAAQGRRRRGLFEMPVWMKGSGSRSITTNNKAVFTRYLTLPATLLQAHARGMIQRRKYQQLRMKMRKQRADMAWKRIQATARGNQCRKFWKCTRASIAIQSMARGWMCRLKFQVIQLTSRLEKISRAKDIKLARFEVKIKLERQRIYNELMAEHNVEFSAAQAQIDETARLYRDNIQKLCEQNKDLSTAALFMAKCNGQVSALTDELNEKIQQLEMTIIPNLEADNKAAQAMLEQWKQRTEEYQAALDECEEHIYTEQLVTCIVEVTIDKMKKRVATSVCCKIQFL